MHNYIAGQGQTDMGLNQRTGVVDLEGGLSCAKSDTNSSLHPTPSSPQATSQQKRQRLVLYFFLLHWSPLSQCEHTYIHARMYTIALVANFLVIHCVCLCLYSWCRQMDFINLGMKLDFDEH